MKSSIISGIKGGLIGSAIAITMFPLVETVLPKPADAVTITYENVVGLVEVSPGICQVDLQHAFFDDWIRTVETPCPVNGESK